MKIKLIIWKDIDLNTFLVQPMKNKKVMLEPLMRYFVRFVLKSISKVRITKHLYSKSTSSGVDIFLHLLFEEKTFKEIIHIKFLSRFYTNHVTCLHICLQVSHGGGRYIIMRQDFIGFTTFPLQQTRICHLFESKMYLLHYIEHVPVPLLNLQCFHYFETTVGEFQQNQ